MSGGEFEEVSIEETVEMNRAVNGGALERSISEPGRDRSSRRRRKWRRVVDPRPMEDMDADIYSTKKSVTQGFMDLALLSANVDQLRTLIKTGDPDSPFYILCAILISLSIVCQVAVAVCLIVKMRSNINKPHHFRKAEKAGNFCLIGSVLLTVINVLTTGFMSDVPPMPPPLPPALVG